MSEDNKREWVFEGSRGEFWLFFSITAFYFAILIRKFVHALDGVVPNATADSSTRYSFQEFFVLTLAFVAFFILTFAFRVFGRWFIVAFGVKTVETAVRIVLGFGRVSGSYALGALVLDYISTLLLFIAFLSYIVRRLRREPLDRATESNPE